MADEILIWKCLDDSHRVSQECVSLKLQKKRRELWVGITNKFLDRLARGYIRQIDTSRKSFKIGCSVAFSGTVKNRLFYVRERERETEIENDKRSDSDATRHSKYNWSPTSAHWINEMCLSANQSSSFSYPDFVVHDKSRRREHRATLPRCFQLSAAAKNSSRISFFMNEAEKSPRLQERDSYYLYASNCEIKGFSAFRQKEIKGNEILINSSVLSYWRYFQC